MEKSRTKTEFWVIGVGASAGGLEAISELVASIPVKFNAAFIIAQHLAPHARSMMVELLNRHSSLNVEAARDGQKIVPGQLLIIPPNHDVDVKDGSLILTRAGEETRPKPSVDRFFSSLAREYGVRSVGIILSGSGSDGADGVRAIKMANGRTFAQDEKSAKYNGMPSSAIETGKIDYVLSPKEIAKQLPVLLESEVPESGDGVSEQEPGFKEIIRLIRKEAGTDFSQYKNPTLRRRLAKRMASYGFEKIADYYEKLKSDPNEVRSLSVEMLVSVSSFFRDAEAFENVRAILKKVLDSKQPGEEIRIWSAGCATGEEPYSLAMTLCELVASSGRIMPVKVFATDLDYDAISHARLGLYSEQDVNSVPSDLLNRYFERKGDMYEVKKGIRDMVVFARQDLIQNPPFVKLDLVSCRNVLIYFESDLQKRILEIFHYALKPGGLLFLGKSENVGPAANLFEPSDRREKIFIRKNVISKVLHTTVRPVTPDFGGPKVGRTVRPPSVADVAQEQMFESVGICGAVVDEIGRIQTIIGDISPYFKIPGGLTDFLFQNLIGKTAAIELQVLISKAAKTKKACSSRALKVDSPRSSGSKTAKKFTLTVEPLRERSESSVLSPSLFVVTVRPSAEKLEGSSASHVEGDLRGHLAEAEQELAATREHLQTVIEELGVTNEELQSVNEELSSTNEELQSSNEELETTNEELQATNEELTTLNEELGVKSSELRYAYTDLENIQSSIGVPLLVVDAELRLKRFNPSANEIFEISASDIGRNVSRISCRCEIANFERQILDVLKGGRPSECIVENYRAIYQMRIMPARDEGQRIVGVVIVFFNNTELINAESRWKASESRIRSIIDGTPSLICLKDMLGRYLLVNEAFLKFFGVEESQVIGHTDREFLPDELANQLRNGDLEALLKRDRIETEEPIVFKDSEHYFLTTRFPIYGEGGSPTGVGMVGMDVTARVRVQKDLLKSEKLYRGLIEDQSVFVCRLKPDGTMVFVNHAFINYFGGSANDYIGKSLTDLMPFDDRPKIAGSFEEIKDSNSVSQMEHRVSKFGAANRWVRWMSRGVFDDVGNLLEIQSVGFDVTEYRTQSEQMVQREMLFSSIFTYTTDFLTVFKVLTNGEFILESFNRSVDRGTGFLYAQYVGRSLREISDPSKREEILQKYEECVKTKLSQSFDEELTMQGGVRHLATTLIPILNSGGNVHRIVALSRDISRFKQSEFELKAAKESAEVANQSKSDFLASMSHELRTPLNVVIGMSQILEAAQLNAEERKQLASIQRSGKILLGLIEDILDLSRIEAGKVKLDFTPFSLNELVGEVVEMFESAALEKNLRLEVDITFTDEESFIGDAARIRQVLVNFFANAIKFTDVGSIKLKVLKRSDKLPTRRMLRFEVEDTGIGIPKESHSRIFHKFSQVESTLSRRYGGSGLGLVISKRLVTLMSGQIGFSSEFNQGSTFWFEVPLTVSTRPSLPRIGSDSASKMKTQSPAGKAVRILGVDDSLDSLNVLGLFLARLGHRSKLVSSGKQALEALREENFDIVLMDVQMPEMDGYATTAAIREMEGSQRHIPVIALTANAMVGDSNRCFEAGMNDYLTKPLEFELLRKLIERWSMVGASEPSGEKVAERVVLQLEGKPHE